jgi:hypothetical protein
VPDRAGYPDAAGLASGELERIARELRASLALARPDSPVRGPILARLTAIDAELSGRQTVPRRAAPPAGGCVMDGIAEGYLLSTRYPPGGWPPS